jgi:mycothiol synthase
MTTPALPALDVRIADAPAIDGLRFRRFADASDWAGLADLARDVAVADEDDEIPSATNLRIATENRPSFDINRDLLIGEVDGRIVASAEGNVSIRDGYAVHYTSCRIHPDWRRRGLGRALLRWNERRAREVAAADPRFAGPSALIGAWASETEPGARALYESEGYQVRRYAFTMIHRHVPDAVLEPLPDGFEIRPVTPDQHRAIFDADDEAFKDHFEHRPATDQDYVALFAQPDLDTSLWRVAWDGDQVAGSVQTWIWKEENEILGVRRGWLESVSVRRPWRRRGLAKALISASLVGLRERGMEEALLGVDAENPNGALALYEGMGFEVKVQAMSYRKPLES